MDQKQTAETLKLLCSYGGKILPRHSDGKLRYVGGLTRVLAVDPSISFSDLMVKLSDFCGYSVDLRCQLPDGDLETLISVKSDEDLANLIEEYDRASRSSSRPLKIRAILTPPKSLKQISPSMSTATSCGGDSSPSKSFMSSYTDSPPPKRYVSLPAGRPVVFQRGSSPRICHHPCYAQRIPNDVSYLHPQYRFHQHHQRHVVPQCNEYWR